MASFKVGGAVVRGPASTPPMMTTSLSSHQSAILPDAGGDRLT